jgi:tripartite-type tricarboxylate transporter receptor subunit TctC
MTPIHRRPNHGPDHKLDHGTDHHPSRLTSRETNRSPNRNPSRRQWALRTLRSALGLALAGLGLGNPAWAENAGDWPSKPITVVVPGAPGGSVDNPTRLLAKRMGEALGQPLVAINKAGSAGIIGTQAALAAPADGHTLLAGNIGPQAINYSAYPQLPYKPGDLRAIGMVISFPNVLVVRADSSIHSVPDLVAHLKRHAGSSFGSAGLGQTTHLMGELFKAKTGAAAIHVPYKGSSPATLGLLAGETTFMFDNLTQALPHIRAGKLRALAITAPQRAHQLPEVPTVAEAGFKDLTATVWVGLFAPAATPAPVLSRLEAAFTTAMNDTKLRAQLVAMGGLPGDLSGAAFERFVQQERQKWRQVIETAQLKFE